MMKTSKEAQDLLFDVSFGLADPTALTIYQAETLMGLLAGEVVEIMMIHGCTPERAVIPLSEGICRVYLQQMTLVKRGLVEISPESLLRLTPGGKEMAAVLVSHYLRICQRLPAMEAVAEQVRKNRVQ